MTGMRNLCSIATVAFVAAALIPFAANAEVASIAVLRSQTSAPLFIAKERGYFQQRNLEPNFIYVEAASNAPNAVVSGDADFAAAGATAGFYNLAGKGALQIIGASTREQPGYQLVAYMVSNKAYEGGLRSVKDFGGRSIGISTVGSTFHYSMGALAEKYGFALSSVRMVPLQSLSNMSAALSGNNVDAILTTANLAKKILDSKSGHLLGWVSDETPWQTSVVVTSTRNAKERSAYVQRFMDAYSAGLRDYYDTFLRRDSAGNAIKGPDYEKLMDVLVKNIGQPRDQLEGDFSYIDREGALLVDDIHKQVAWWKSQGMVAANVDSATFIDLRFVSKKN